MQIKAKILIPNQSFWLYKAVLQEDFGKDLSKFCSPFFRLGQSIHYILTGVLRHFTSSIPHVSVLHYDKAASNRGD